MIVTGKTERAHVHAFSPACLLRCVLYTHKTQGSLNVEDDQLDNENLNGRPSGERERERCHAGMSLFLFFSGSHCTVWSPFPQVNSLRLSLQVELKLPVGQHSAF